METEIIKDLGEFEFHPNYFIGRIYEGVNADSGFVDALSALLFNHYAGSPVIYISDRVNSFSSDPSATKELILKNNIRYAAVVTYSKIQSSVLSFETTIVDNITIKRWSFKHPYGHEIVGHVRLWSMDGVESAKNVASFKPQKSNQAPQSSSKAIKTSSGVSQGIDFGGDADF